MCPDTLPEWEFIEIWERIVNRIDVRNITLKSLKIKLKQQRVYNRRLKHMMPDGRAILLVNKKFPEKFMKRAYEDYNSEMARDIWGIRRIEKWGKAKTKMVVWRDKHGKFTRSVVKLTRPKPQRQTIRTKKISRSKPRR